MNNSILFGMGIQVDRFDALAHPRYEWMGYAAIKRHTNEQAEVPVSGRSGGGGSSRGVVDLGIQPGQ